MAITKNGQPRHWLAEEWYGHQAHTQTLCGGGSAGARGEVKEQRVYRFQPLNQGTGWLQGETETGVQVVGESVYDGDLLDGV